MKKNCKFCWLVSGVLFVTVATMAYLFVIKGSVIEASDGRTSILLTEGERNHVLGEMRMFLETVNDIIDGANTGDMATVAQSATAVGMILTKGEDPAMMAKLPIDFKTLGFSTHSAFDDLAQNATDFGDAKMVMTDLSGILNNCTSCHAGYRFDVDPN